MLRGRFSGLLAPDADGIDFLLRGDLDDLADAMDGRRYSLAVIDTMGRLFRSRRELEGDSYMAWQESLDEVRTLATATGCHIALLHHARKSGGDRSLAVLGSAAIGGAADSVLSLVVEEEDGRGALPGID